MKETRKFRIEDTQGRWYDGDGYWTQKSQAYVFAGTEILPSFITGPNGERLEKEVFADGYDVDVRYFVEGQEEPVAVVRVETIETFEDDE
jgi:hypothetical protein